MSTPEIIREMLEGDGFPLWQPHHRASPDGETLADFNRRVVGFCEAVLAGPTGSEIVVVAHGGIINEALRWAVGLTESQPWQHHFELPNGSITQLAIWPNGRSATHAPRYCTLLRIGDTGHLPGPRTIF